MSAMLHVRLDEATKDKATAVLDSIGLSASDAVRLLYHRLIADQAFPLELKVPNGATRAALAEANAMLVERRTRFANGTDLIADLEASSRK